LLHFHPSTSGGSVTFGNDVDLNASFKWAKNQSSSYTYSAADSTGMYIERFSTAGAGSQLADMRFQARDNNTGTYNSIRIKGSDNTVVITSPNTIISGNVDVDGGTLNVGSSNEVSIVSSGSSHFPSLKVNNNGYLGSASVPAQMQLLSSGNTIFAGSVNVKNALIDTNSTTSATATTAIASVAHATYTAAFFDFVIKNGTNVRAGTVYACHNGASTPLVEFTETSTVDLGDTSDVTLAVVITNNNLTLQATSTSNSWTIKTLIRAI
jgi:hypothetical protein